MHFLYLHPSSVSARHWEDNHQQQLRLLLIYSAPAGPRPAGPPGKPQVLCPAEPGSTLLANREAIPAKAHCLRCCPTRWSGQRNRTTQTAGFKDKPRSESSMAISQNLNSGGQGGVRQGYALLSLQPQLCRGLKQMNTGYVLSGEPM